MSPTPVRSSRRSQRLWPLLGLSAIVFSAAGCKATCADVCDQIVDCDGLPTARMSSAECEESCKSQSDQYDGWADGQKQDALQDELDCLSDSTCDDIAAGVCYNEAIWNF